MGGVGGRRNDTCFFFLFKSGGEGIFGVSEGVDGLGDDGGRKEWYAC